MRDVAGKLVRLPRFGRSDKTHLFRRRDQLADVVAFGIGNPETFPQAFVGHVVVHQVAQTGVEVAGMDTFGGAHFPEDLLDVFDCEVSSRKLRKKDDCLLLQA